jgi:ribosomal protein L19
MRTVFLSEKLRARDYLGDRWRRADNIEMDLIQTTRERVNCFKGVCLRDSEPSGLQKADS